MLNVNDIKEVKFSNSMGGYKKDEVDAFLDSIVADYEEYENKLKAALAKIDKLNAELSEKTASEGSIQTVLLNAQKLADEMVAEAKTKSAQIVKEAEQSIKNITEKENELSEAFERKANARKEEVENEYRQKTAEAQKKLEAIEKATADSIARQQMLFDRMKIEISAFKADINKKYKEHLEMLQKLPDEVPSDPKTIAAAVSEVFDRTPSAEAFIEDVKEAPAVQADEKQETEEDPAQAEPYDIQSNKKPTEKTDSNAGGFGGFIVNTDDE